MVSKATGDKPETEWQRQLREKREAALEAALQRQLANLLPLSGRQIERMQLFFSLFENKRP